jgi:hypothetical protein
MSASALARLRAREAEIRAAFAQKLKASKRRMAEKTGRREHTVSSVIGAGVASATGGAMGLAHRYLPPSLARPAGVPIDAYVALAAIGAAFLADRVLNDDGITFLTSIGGGAGATALNDLTRGTGGAASSVGGYADVFDPPPPFIEYDR